MRVPVICVSVATLTLIACTPDAPPVPRAPPPGSWTLQWCGGISWAGCGTGGLFVYPDKASCYEALGTMRSGDQPVAESGLKRNTVAICRPSTGGDGA